ncbi:MAG: hypothetical protein HKP57_07495 [Halobacteria archaeon]|nr:hypothetical protein [Halobacteria archaeon]
MQHAEFIDSLGGETCPAGLDPCLQALWHEARGDWETAHAIVQDIDSVMAARIHAYLHRREGEDWNARYWHRQAGTAFPSGVSLEDERDTLVRELTDWV